MGAIQRNGELEGYYRQVIRGQLRPGSALVAQAWGMGTAHRKEDNYLYKERRYGTFSRSVLIPVKVKSDKTEAVFEDGVLTLTLPKAEEVKPKQIKVKTKQITEGKKAETKKPITELHSPLAKLQEIVEQSEL
jgi:HSP20 family protein